MRFQQRLGQQRPPGFGGSASFRVAEMQLATTISDGMKKLNVAGITR
jgi:hypothetical protein